MSPRGHRLNLTNKRGSAEKYCSQIEFHCKQIVYTKTLSLGQYLARNPTIVNCNAVSNNPFLSMCPLTKVFYFRPLCRSWVLIRCLLSRCLRCGQQCSYFLGTPWCRWAILLTCLQHVLPRIRKVIRVLRTCNSSLGEVLGLDTVI